MKTIKDNKESIAFEHALFKCNSCQQDVLLSLDQVQELIINKPDNCPNCSLAVKICKYDQDVLTYIVDSLIHGDTFTHAVTIIGIIFGALALMYLPANASFIVVILILGAIYRKGYSAPTAQNIVILEPVDDAQCITLEKNAT